MTLAGLRTRSALCVFSESRGWRPVGLGGELTRRSACASWRPQVRSLVSLKDLGQCIVTLQESVFTKFLQGFMDPKQNKRKKKQNGEEGSKVEEAEEEKRLADEARVTWPGAQELTVGGGRVVLSSKPPHFIFPLKQKA